MTAQIPDTRLIEALSSLNEIAKTVNQIGLDGTVSVNITLKLIAESITRTVPEASVIIFTYDKEEEKFIFASRASADEKGFPDSRAEPRANGLGMRAIIQRRGMLSYEEKDIEIHTACANAGVKVIGCFPLIITDMPVGVLYVCLQNERPFIQLELLMLENFANQAAMAIYHANNLVAMKSVIAGHMNQ